MIDPLWMLGLIWFAIGAVRALLIISVSHRAYALTVHNISVEQGYEMERGEILYCGILYYLIALATAFIRWPKELLKTGWAFFRPPTDEEITEELGLR
jgi:hypothetical protein